MKEIYQNYAKDIFKYLLHECNDKELAEDLTHETIIRATFGIKKFRKDCTVKVWLFQIAKNLLRKERKKQEKLKTVPLDTEIGTIGVSRGIEDELIEDEDRVEVYRQINNLESPESEIMNLRLILEFSFAEIGQMFGRNDVWARGNFYKGKCKLMKNLRKGGKT